MLDRECNASGSPSAVLDSKGGFWFTTIKGVVHLQNQEQAHPIPAPVMHIEEVVADNISYHPRGAIVFPAGTRHVHIKYTGISLAATERLRFEHRLEGLDEAPVQAGDERSVQYSGLPYGEYRFQVRAIRDDGLASEVPAQLSFRIEPHFWQTRGFHLVVGLLVLGLIFLADRLRHRRARLRELELKKRVEEEMAKVKVLTGFLPVCSWCNKIEDENGAWLQMEAYISQRSQAKFTHGMCPQCYERFKKEQNL